MKKQIFTLSLLGLFFYAGAQRNLKDLLNGEGGVSNHFTKLPDGEQVIFNPSQAREIFDLDKSSDLEIKAVETDNIGFTNYRYFQTYKGLPIENSMLIAHVKNGKLVSMSGEVVTEFDNTMLSRSSAAISEKQAIGAAIKYVGAKLYAWQDADMENSIKQEKGNAGATYFPATTLVWFSGADDISPRNLRVAYKVDVYARQPLSRAFYFVDAQTGKVLGKKDELFYADAVGTASTVYSGSRTIHSDLNSSVYRLRDLTKGGGILTYHGESGKRGTDYTSTTANWILTATNQAALDAHYGVSQTYAFYLANFNRNSYDNLGSALRSYVNDPTYTDNAFWDGSAMNFNMRSSSTLYPGGVTGIDVTGHELTHGVTQETSGLSYSKEPGAINESMSDIMGKSIQFWSKPTDINWNLSNDMNWVVRSFSNPNAQGQPDTYKGTYWISTSADNYGLHTNSGVGNFMFYLLVNGGSGTNDKSNTYSVTGIGLTKADQIIYRSNTTYLTPTSQYADWRQACINAAGDLYPGNAAVLAAVQNAWYAVGVGSAAGINACSVPSGLSATSVSTSSAVVNWASAGAATYNLQWKPSTATSWTTVSGIAGTSYNLTSLTAGTTYQFQVQSACVGTTGTYSTTASFSTPAIGGASYCTSIGTTKYEYIQKVVLGSINNTSGNNSGYGNYAGLSANVSAGASCSISLTPAFAGSSYTEYWTVFADYNQDGDFTDVGEKVLTASGSSTITKTFTIPATAKSGSTRLRIQMKYGSPASSNPCAALSNGGEVEDYTINISGGTFSPLPTIVEVKKAGIQVCPNPVTGSSATITYTVAKQGKVYLRVMDMYGRLVQTIAAGQKAAGTYVIYLNDMQKFATGNYIISITQDNSMVGKTNFMVGK